MVRYLKDLGEYRAALAQGPCIIYFTATWCGPCQKAGPIYDGLADENSKTLNFFKVDVDANDETKDFCGVTAMPTFQVYDEKGRKVEEIRGLDPPNLSRIVQEAVQRAELLQTRLTKDPKEMSIREMKVMIKDVLGAEILVQCVSKDDLRRRTAEAQQKAQKESEIRRQGGGAEPSSMAAAAMAASSSSSSSSSSASSSTSSRTIGPFQCEVSGLDKPCDLLLVLFHGFGASASEMASWGSSLLSSLRAPPSTAITLVCPQAPTPKGFPVPAWWPLNEMAMRAAFLSGESAMAKALREKPKGIDTTRRAMKEFMEALLGEAGQGKGGMISMREGGKVVLGGFSQGAVMAVDGALLSLGDDRHPVVDGVIAASLFPITVDEWYQRANALGLVPGKWTLPVLLLHGTHDPRIPCQPVVGWSEGLLRNCGMTVTKEIHGGAHDLGPAGTVDAAIKKWMVASGLLPG